MLFGLYSVEIGRGEWHGRVTEFGKALIKNCLTELYCFIPHTVLAHGYPLLSLFL